MKPMTADEIAAVLAAHKKWLCGDEDGRRAVLRGADLRDADLSGADLRRAVLRGAVLRDAVLSDADLSRADLRGADLRGADLSGADLWGLVGNLRHVKSLQTDTYLVTYTADVMQIGCQRYPIADWWAFDDRRILEMDGKRALDWWRRWKPLHRRFLTEVYP